MANKIQFRDRLRDRGFIDQWGFIAFAIVGFAAIVSAKALGLQTEWVAVGAVTAMFAYAVLIARSGTGRVRADQAGDNCYYLGLIYTLASLSYAIANFDPKDTASGIVQGFGIALATTIFGLILRVFFSQGRPDLENQEDQVRLELTEAVSRLKGELNSVVVSVNDFSRMFRQSMEETHKAATASIEQFAVNSVERLASVVDAASAGIEQSTGSSVKGLVSVTDTATASIKKSTLDSLDGLGEVVGAAAKSIRDEANDFAARSKKYSTKFDSLLARLERHGESVDQLSEAHDGLTKTATVAAGVAESASAAVQLLAQGAQSANDTAVSARDAVRLTQELIKRLGDTLGGVETNLQAVREETDRRLDALMGGPSEMVKSVVDGLAQAYSSLERHIAEVEALEGEAHLCLAAQQEAAVELAKRHNDGLAIELERSRHLVTKVHSSLAEMTGKLASSIELNS